LFLTKKLKRYLAPGFEIMMEKGPWSNRTGPEYLLFLGSAGLMIKPAFNIRPGSLLAPQSHPCGIKSPSKRPNYGCGSMQPLNICFNYTK
jgi:hypothetical protein